jgi:hypothetical protein
MSTVGPFCNRYQCGSHGGQRRGDDFYNPLVANFLIAVQDSARSALSYAIGWNSLIAEPALLNGQRTRTNGRIHAGPKSPAS